MLTATIGFTGDYVLENWSNETLANGETSITPTSDPSDEATFGYDLTLNTGGLFRQQTVDFLATAAATGTVTFDYEFTGNSRFFQAEALFATVTGGGATPVVDGERTSGNFSFSGSASFIAQQGQDLGFRIGGANVDSNRDINGQLRVTNIVFNDEISAPIVVDTDSDVDDGDLSPGNLSLREAVRLANEAAGADTITFAPSLAGSTITLTEGQLEIRSSITINGLGAKELTVSGGGVSRVFSEEGNGQRIITITDMTIADGLANNGGGFFSNGGRVTFERVVMTNNNSLGNNGSTIVMAFGTLEISNSAIVGNLNTGVGALRLQDNVTTITNTTISGNGTRGVSFFNSNSTVDTLTLDSVTIADNANAGIEAVAFGSTTLLEYRNTIFANNGGQGGIDARGNDAGLPGLSIVSLGHNLLDDTPAGDAAHDAAPGDIRNGFADLQPLADNGGPTPTHALGVNSDALDAGNSLLATDQRGVARPADLAGVANAPNSNASDIGAFEAYGPLVLPGDYNLDGHVDAADYTVWRDQLGATSVVPFSGPDGDGDGEITQSDRDVWVSNYGRIVALEAKIDLVGVARSAETPSETLVAPPAPGESLADPASAIDVEPLPEANDAVVDTVLAAFGLPMPHLSLPIETTTPERATAPLAFDRDWMLIQPLHLAHDESGETDQDAGLAREQESGSTRDEQQVTASLRSFLDRLG